MSSNADKQGQHAECLTDETLLVSSVLEQSKNSESLPLIIMEKRLKLRLPHNIEIYWQNDKDNNR